MTSKSLDPVRAAIEIFIKIRDEVGSEKEGSKLRARSRDAPEMFESMGLIPALSFFYSKKDNKDYRLMLKAILLYLKKIGVVSSGQDVDALISNPRQMVDELQNLFEKSKAILPILRPFLVEFKRLCEASWEAGER